jgi:TPR repeat protein
MHALGRAYAANRQMPEAIAAWRKAVEKGSTAAMIELGLALSSGAGGTKDQEQGRAHIERAAQAGDPRAIAHLMTQGGSGAAPSDPVKARAMFSAAAERNSAEAQFQLGIMSAEGVGGSKDDVAARALFEKAAAQNHAGALEWLGAFAHSGRGGPKDEAAAKTYYERAAALGNPNAKAALERIRCPYVLKNKQGEVWSNLCL